MLEYLTSTFTDILIGDNYFIEELSNSQFTSYAEVSSLAGISTGTLIHEGSGWLRFIMDNKELIVAKKNIRRSMHWSNLNSQGCVFGTKTINIKGTQYKVRLLTGADSNPSVNIKGNYVQGTHLSEWSRLLYPLIKDDSHIDNAEGLYTQEDLQMLENPRSWCQETPQGDTTLRVARGYYGVSSYEVLILNSTDISRGWRPCLERIA